MTRRLQNAVVAATTTAIVGLAATHALGIPTFARIYGTSCATCHQAWPRLNAVGESFRIAGYRFLDDERYRKVEPLELGDEAYKRLWPDSLWPTDIPRNPPLSFITRFMAEVDLDGSRANRVSTLLPEEVELVWAGTFSDDFTFYGDIIFLQKDFGGASLDSWAVLKGWLQVNDLLGVEDRLNLRLGTVGTQTMGLFTARDANFYGTHTYLYTTWFMPTPDLAQAGLTEFKGNNFSIGPLAGFEVNGFGERWFYAVGMVRGDLQYPALSGQDGDVSFFGMGQGSQADDLYVQLAYKVGGLPWGPVPEEQGGAAPRTGAEFWRDDSLIMSLFGFSGTAAIKATTVEGEHWKADDDFWRLGVGIQKNIKDFSFSAAYVAGRNDNPYGRLDPAAVDSTAWHVETLAFAYPWLIPFVRYESLNLDLPTDLPGLDPEQDIARVMYGAKVMIRPNISLTFEGSYYTRGEELEEGFDQTVFVLLGMAF